MNPENERLLRSIKRRVDDIGSFTIFDFALILIFCNTCEGVKLKPDQMDEIRNIKCEVLEKKEGAT